MIRLTPAEPNEVPDGLKQSLKQWQSAVVLDDNALALKGYNNDELCVIVTLKFHAKTLVTQKQRATLFAKEGLIEPTAEIEQFIWKYADLRTGADKEFAFVIGSGILNFIDRRGIRNVWSADKTNEYILKLLKFEYDIKSDKFTLDLTGYFESDCKR